MRYLLLGSVTYNAASMAVIGSVRKERRTLTRGTGHYYGVVDMEKNVDTYKRLPRRRQNRY